MHGGTWNSLFFKLLFKQLIVNFIYFNYIYIVNFKYEIFSSTFNWIQKPHAVNKRSFWIKLHLLLTVYI